MRISIIPPARRSESYPKNERNDTGDDMFVDISESQGAPTPAHGGPKNPGMFPDG